MNGPTIRKIIKKDHPGRILNATRTSDGWEIRIGMTIKGDRYNRLPDFPAQWKLQLKEQGGQLSGTYTGTVQGVTVSGTLSGTVGSPTPRISENFQAIQPGEHPRLLFRQADLPELRNRAQTEQGQQIMARLSRTLSENLTPENAGYHAAGYGLQYVLTGEKFYATRAAEIVDLILRNKVPGGQNFWISSHKLILRAPPAVGVAMAYDLCYHGWDEEFRLRVASALEKKALELQEGRGKGTNEHPHSNWMGLTRGAMGICA